MADLILKTRNKPGLKNQSFIGANIPNELYFKVLLYITANGTTKNTFIKEVLQSTFNSESTGLSTKVLMDKLICRIHNSYKSKKQINPELTKERFVELLSLELNLKGFEQDSIKLIIDRFYGKE